MVYTKYIRKGLINMPTSIQKWGNSQGIRIPKIVLDSVKWAENEEVVILVKDDKLIIEKSNKSKKKNIRELFENYKGGYVPQEVDWGCPEGREIW